MGLIQKFPERMHKTLKWMHRNVSSYLPALELLQIQTNLPDVLAAGPSNILLWVDDN